MSKSKPKSKWRMEYQDNKGFKRVRWFGSKKQAENWNRNNAVIRFALQEIKEDLA